MDELYGLPPGEFVAARDALAKRLRAEGDKDAAAEVKALRRPTVVAWAVNQVARDSRQLVDAVVEAGAAVRAAQEEVLGGGDRGSLRSASAARRDAVGAATRAAIALAGETHRDEITATFDAAALDDAAAAQVRSGRLTSALRPPSGFAALPDLPDVVDRTPDRRDDRAAKEARRRADAAEASAAEARLAAEKAEERRARLAEELADAEQAAADAREAADAAEEEAREARATADEA